jgi:hypothetical protein
MSAERHETVSRTRDQVMANVPLKNFIGIAGQSDAKALLPVHREAVFSKAVGYCAEARLEAWALGYPGEGPRIDKRNR